MERQGSERTDGGLEVQDGVGRACWKKLGTRKWATRRHVGFRLPEKHGAWKARRWVFGSGALRKVVDLLFALLMMWSVSKNIVEKKKSSKISPENTARKMLTVMRAF